MRALLAFALAAAAASVERANAQDWPARPLTMVVPVAAGSSSDVVGRIVAQRISERLGQPVIVENSGGAGGMTGATGWREPARRLRACYRQCRHPRGQPDALQASALQRRDRLCAGRAGRRMPHVLLARKDLPATNLAEFHRLRQSKPAKMQFGSPGAGSVDHLACALLNLSARIEVTHIPYRGPIMPDLIAGRIDYWCPTVTVAIPQLNNQAVRALANLTWQAIPEPAGLVIGARARSCRFQRQHLERAVST